MIKIFCRYIGAIVMLLGAFNTEAMQSPVRLLIIDTGFHDQHYYHIFTSLAESVGFAVEFKPFYDIDAPILADYDAVMFFIDPSFLQALSNDVYPTQPIQHPLLIKTINMVKTYSSLHNKIFGLVFPPIPGSGALKAHPVLVQLCRTYNIIPAEEKTEVERVVSKWLQALLESDSKKSCLYNTALLTIRDASGCVPSFFIQQESAQQHTPYTLPQGQTSIEEYPELAFHKALALYRYDPQLQNHFFISKSSWLLFADIQENFVYNPCDIQLRNALQEHVQQFLYELYQLYTKNKDKTPKPSLPQALLPSSIVQESHDHQKMRSEKTDARYAQFNNEGIWCGWSRFDAYKGKEQEAALHLLESGVNALWFEWNPEVFLSKNGVRKDGKDDFLARIQAFTKALVEQSQKTGKKMPHIFMGTDLTTNFGQVPVQHPVTDLYGNVYSKIPTPFDITNFWQPEFLEVFDAFVRLWSNSIGNGVPLAGVFFDLEMYHAQQQSGQYTSEMDFSDFAWNLYRKHNPTVDAHVAAKNRLRYLLDRCLLQNYFEFLQQEARAIGALIKKHIHAALPNAIIGIYNMHLPHAWFYKGFAAGLSSPQGPLLFATFGNDFTSHCAWLEKQGIYAYHMPVFLLSKLRSESDFPLISEYAAGHDGVWFNCIEHLERSRNPKDWPWDFGVEVTMLPTPLVVQEMNKQIMLWSKK